MNYSETLSYFLPELLIVLTALAVMVLGIASEKGRSRRHLRRHLWAVAASGLVLAGILLCFQPESASIPGRMLALDPLSRLFKGILLGMSFLTLGLTAGRPRKEHQGEYIGLILFATVGMLLVVGSEDLLMVFLSLELVSLSLYILAGFDRSNPRVAEGALKYFLFGSVAAAFMLFGFSLIYGYAHTTYLPEIAASLASMGMEPLLAAGIIMILVGFGFKVAAVPFHLWAPDTYQAAPLPSVVLIASGSKVAGFFVLAKILAVGLSSLEGSAGWGSLAAGWVPFLVVLAVLSMFLGNLAALAQRSSVRRLLGYSAIAHAGYILLGLSAGNHAGVSAVLFYVIIYGLTTIGAFGVVGVFQKHRGGDRPEDFAGMSREMPGMAFCLLIFFISLAGIPPLVGFFGKFHLFLAALDSTAGLEAGGGMLWAVALGVALNAVSLYYYLMILKQVYLEPPPSHADSAKLPNASIPLPARCVIGFTTCAVIYLGIFPEQLLSVL